MIWSIIIIQVFAIVGYWLESINGKHGLADRLLTPVPFALVGICFEILRRL